MKKLILSAMVVSSFGIAASAFAADPVSSGTITFTGEVGNQTCSVHGGTADGPADFTVPLSKVQAGSLATAGQVAGTKPYKIIVGADGSTECAEGTAVHIAYDVNNGVTPQGYLPNKATGATAATEVALQLLDVNGNPIDLSTNPKSQTQMIEAGSTEFNFFAQYIATGTATAGAVTSSVMYSLAYD